MSKNRGETISKLEALLEAAKDQKGHNLYEHLLKVFSHLALSDASGALDRFEEISFKLKHEGQLPTQANFLEHKQLAADLSQWVDNIKKDYFEAKKQGGEGEEEEVIAETGTLMYVPDLLGERKMFEWAGIGFSEEDTYLLMKSMKKLAATAEAKGLRFWGKIFGREKDYYIVEGMIDPGEPEEGAPEDMESKGTGINQFTYWVADSVCGTWTQLPDITPVHLKLSRMLKHVFSGNLNETLITNPFFKGEEKYLLRAQIARITHSTTLIPRGQFKVVEDEDGKKGRELEAEEEPKNPTTLTTGEMGVWLHYLPSILKCGRVVHMPPVQAEGEGEEVEPEILQARMEAKDPFDERLKPINTDAAFQGCQTSWTMNTLGDQTIYKDETGKGMVSYAVHVIKSLVWPGAMTLFQNGRYNNIYMGYGLKADNLKYYPIYPPEVINDPIDMEEQDEPNPKEAPVEEAPEGEGAEGEEGAEAEPEEDE